MIPIPASILAIENESDRDFMENIFFSYQRLIYHEIGSILNDPWSKDDIFQTVIVQLINNIDTLRPMPAKVLTSYIATSARNAALTYIRNISRRKEILADEFDNSNVIASQKATSLRPQLAQKAPEDIDVEYRTVTYSLSELERIKNFLTGYMSDYSIMMLDANEITNQVDISLKDYSDDNIESIKAAVLSHGGKTDYLNFIDDSNNVIRSTVGYETDNNASPFSLYGKVPVSFTAKASTTQYLTGGKILIGNYAYTLGPALSASKAYSAGHGFSGTVDVKDLMGTKIGSATSHLGSLSGDWSKITPYGGEFFPVVAKATPIAGKQVYMLGATSGETVGKITRTGVSVQFPPYVTLTDMCEGNYECNPGDSGAGLFDSGAKDVLTASSNAKTYGIQSSGKFNEKGEWIGPSYFTPISNVS